MLRWRVGMVKDDRVLGCAGRDKSMSCLVFACSDFIDGSK